MFDLLEYRNIGLSVTLREKGKFAFSITKTYRTRRYFVT